MADTGSDRLDDGLRPSPSDEEGSSSSSMLNLSVTEFGPGFGLNGARAADRSTTVASVPAYMPEGTVDEEDIEPAQDDVVDVAQGYGLLHNFEPKGKAPMTATGRPETPNDDDPGTPDRKADSALDLASIGDVLPKAPGFKAAPAEQQESSTSGRGSCVLPEDVSEPETNASKPVPGSKVVDSDISTQPQDVASEPPASPDSSTTSDQKQKPNDETEAGPSHPGSTADGSGVDSATPSSSFQPLKYGDPGWEKSADRPPKKFPIRFRDAVGRNFAFPWEKAKTWEGMERLIRSCFIHVEIIGPHVNQGHYDLVASLPFSMEITSAITSSSQEASAPASSVPPAQQAPGSASPHTPSSPPSPSTGPSTGTSGTPNAGGGTFPTPPQAPMPLTLSPPNQAAASRSAVIILPELWDEMAEPGMVVHMYMWPLPQGSYNSAPPVPPPPQPAQPQPHHHNQVGPGWGRGRGRGAGAGVGRGLFAAPPGPPRPPGWMMPELPKARGKTRKKSGA